MKKNNRYLSALLVLLLAVAFLLCGCGRKIVFTTGLSANQVLKAEGETLTLAEAKLYLTTLANEYKSFYGYDLWKGVSASGDASQDEALEDYVKNRTMERIQNIFCMYLMAESREITLTEEETAMIEQAATEYYESLTKEEIKYMGISRSTVEEAYTRYTLAEKLYDSMTEDVDLEVSDNEARVMDAQVIYVTDEGKASEVQAKLASGNDFATVASAYTEYSSVSQHISRENVPEEVADAAFALEEEEISSMIETDGSYYFVKCTNKLNQELTNENRNEIMLEKQESAFDEAYREFVLSLNLQVNETEWEKLEVNVEEDVATTDFFQVYNSWFATDGQ